MTEREFIHFVTLSCALLIALLIIGVCVNGFIGAGGFTSFVVYAIYVDTQSRQTGTRK